MNNSLHISASILSADFAKLGEEIKQSESAGVDRFHIDVMDGHFVPNITIGPVIVQAVRPHTKLPLETHLMIEHPWDYIDAFIDAGSDIICLQVECYGQRRKNCREYGQFPKEVDTFDDIKFLKDAARIKARGKKTFATLNPGTPVCLEKILKSIDGVLVMSVNPGFANQKFMPQALPKIEQLRRALKFSGDIAVDGGVNDATAPQVVKSGANVLVTASHFFGTSNRAAVVQRFKNL